MIAVQDCRRERGASLVGVLVSLAVASILLTMLAQAVSSFLGVSTAEREVSGLTSRVTRLHSRVNSLIHDAGFGLPGLSNCPANTLIGNFQGSTDAEYPVSASPETSSQYGSVLPANMDTLTVTYGQSVDGSSVMARVVSLPANSSSVVEASSAANIETGDGFVMEIPGQACFLLSNTGTSGNSGDFVNWHFNNSSASNPPAGVSSLLNYMANNGIGNANLQSSDFNNARLLIVGTTTVVTWYIQGQTLMGTFIVTGANGPTTVTTPIMKNVLAMRVSLGTGTGGQVQNWMSASQWQNLSVSNRPPVIAVQVGFLVMSDEASSQVQTPASVSLMGQTFPIPASDEGRLVSPVQFTLPVNNALWSD